MRAVATSLLNFIKAVFRVGQNIRNLNWPAFHKDTPGHRSASSVKRQTLDKLAEFYRVAVARRSTEAFISGAKDLSHICFAQSRCRFDERIEHGLQIESRTADDLEYVGSGGLLLQRLAQFAKQPRVLDGDDGLGGKVR